MDKTICMITFIEENTKYLSHQNQKIILQNHLNTAHFH